MGRKVNIPHGFQLQVVLSLIYFLCLFSKVSSTSCPIDAALEVTQPGNSYECPDLLPNGQPNEYNFCCQNDRPDENGDYHSCCQDPDASDAAKMQEFINICIIIVCITIALMIGVFCHTYCRDDTFPCLAPVKKDLKKWYDMMMDSLCFCSCCPKKLRRKTKKERLEEKKEAEVVKEVHPSQMEVPIDDFWI
ncbi:uncharacterized protein [Amphiura filiformis]|uniref:uncharacterized protein n=1 Tax=Amphiura filiformis TaxID=82378 RepID=UPI003B2115F3